MPFALIGAFRFREAPTISVGEKYATHTRQRFLFRPFSSLFLLPIRLFPLLVIYFPTFGTTLFRRNRIGETDFSSLARFSRDHTREKQRAGFVYCIRAMKNSPSIAKHSFACNPKRRGVPTCPPWSKLARFSEYYGQ